MKVARMLFVVALIVGAGQVVSGHGGHEGNDHSQAGQAPTRRDQLRIAVQEICPVSGEKLGSMGESLKVQVGEETIFLCCEGCMKQKINPEHWATIHANFARAQRICPVMKKELPKNPKWTVVEGQIVYICCKGCDKKIAANPQKFLREIDGLYAASLDARKRLR